MRRKAVRRPAIRNIWTYLKDYRFSSILLKYFLLLFLCLVLPITVVEMWFSRQQKEQVYEEIIKRNEASLAQGYSSVYSILKSSKIFRTVCLQTRISGISPYSPPIHRILSRAVTALRTCLQ